MHCCFHTLITLFELIVIFKSYSHGQRLMVRLGVDGFKHKALIICIFRLSNQIILQVVELHLLISLTKHMAGWHIEFHLLLLPDSQAITQRIHILKHSLPLSIIRGFLSIFQFFEEPNYSYVFLYFLYGCLGVISLEYSFSKLILLLLLLYQFLVGLIDLRFDGILRIV